MKDKKIHSPQPDGHFELPLEYELTAPPLGALELQTVPGQGTKETE